MLTLARNSNAGVMLDHDTDAEILKFCEQLALDAGRRIMEIVHEGFSAELKMDSSPVTLADREAERIILEGLRSRYPQIPVVAEEEAAAGREPQNVGSVFFLVDPLDGTREFVRGGDDYTVNIGLVRAGVPVAGVIYAPARFALYSGAEGGAWEIPADAQHVAKDRRAIQVRSATEPLKIVASRSHNTPETDEFIARYKGAERMTVGSSLKFCLLASGQADLYPRMGRTMQWDTAAGDAILRAAGGITRELDGAPYRYGPGLTPGDEDFANRHFIAEGRLA